MAQGGTRKLKTFGKRIKDQSEDIKKLYSLVEQRNTVQQISTQIQGQTSNTVTQQFLKTAGDTMIGPIAFLPVLITLSASKTIDIGKDSGNFSSRVILANSGAFQLETISGAAHNGQILFLQGVQTETIVITNAGNIETIDGNNFTIEDDDIILFQFDVTDNKWQQVTIGKQGAGGVSFPVTPTIKDHGTGWSNNVAIDLSLSTAHIQKITLNKNLIWASPTGFPAADTQIEFEIEYVQDATGGRTVTQWAEVVETVTIASAANAITIITYRTNDGGTNYHAVPSLRGSISLNGSGFLKNIVEDTTPQLGGDLDFLTFDGTSIDRLRFSLDSNAAASSGDPSIFLKTDTMIFNMPTDDTFQFNNNDVASFFGGKKIGGSADSFLRVYGVDTSLANLEIENDKATPATGLIGGLNWYSQNDATSFEYASIDVNNEGLTVGAEESSMLINVREGGSLVPYFTLNSGGVTGLIDVHKDIDLNLNVIYFDETADDSKIFGTATSVEIHVGGVQYIDFSGGSVNIPSTTTLQINELFKMNATVVNGGVDGEMWHDSGTGDILARSGGNEVNLSDLSSGLSPPFNDNQVIIQDKGDNTKTLSFNLSLQDGSAANLLSWASGGSRTHTFSSTTGTVAQLNLTQIWSALQTFQDGNLLVGDAGASNTLLLKASGMTADKTATFPDNTGIVAELNLAQTFSAIQTFTANLIADGLANLGTTANPWNNIVTDNTLFCSNLKVFDSDSDINVFNDLDLQAGVAIDFTDTATTAGAGARTLPSNPVDFLVIKVNGVSRRIPFYTT